jgi:putative peptidoglycan lipid II flippase
MVRAFLTVLLGREMRGMHQAAYVLALFALCSQVLALVRDRLLAGSFGAGHTLDIYYAAFRIPDFLFATVASLLSLYALLPVLSRLGKEHAEFLISFMRKALLIFFLVIGSIAAVLFFIAPTLIPLVAPGIAVDPIASAQLLLLVRILLLQPILLGASNILATLTQLRHRFVLYSISPLLYNVGIIIGILYLYPKMGLPGLAWGVVLGAFLHVTMQIPFFAAQKSRKIPWLTTLTSLREVLILSVPRTLALAAGQISLLALVAMASFFAPGSIAVFMFAFNLQAVPLTIIGVSYSVAAFPTLARFHAEGDTAEFVRHIETALRHILFWSMPALILMIVLRAQIVRVILGSGAFDWDATRLTAATLSLFILSLVAQSMTLLLARAYYAAGKTKIPLLLGLLSVVTSIASALLLVFAFHANVALRYFLESLFRVSDIAGTTVLLLALAYTIGSLVQCGFGLRYFSRDFSVSYGPLRRLAFQSFGASVIGGSVAYAVLSLFGSSIDIRTLLGIALQGAAGGCAGLAAAAFILFLLKNEELAEVWGSIHRRFRDTPPVALEPSDVSS